MRTAARMAIARALADLIKADSIIDLEEVLAYSNLREKYAINQKCEQLALSISLSCALKYLEDEGDKIKTRVLEACKALSKSDGYCEASEARLLLAFEYCLSDKCAEAEVISIPEQSVKLEFGQIIYVEGRKSESVNKSINANYRTIVNELRSIGLDFVYIPYVASHYLSCNKNGFSQVVSFLAPQLSDEEKCDLINHLSQMTTTQFCKEQLCIRLGMLNLSDTPPSLLLKINNSYVNDRLYGDYLRFSIGVDVLQSIRNFVDQYKGYLSFDGVFVSNVEESQGKFLYHGFYKQLFDMYTIRDSVECSLEINPYKGEIRFVEINQVVDGLKRKEKAFYLWMLLMSREGGFSYASLTTTKQLQSYNKKMKESLDLFRKVYERFGGERESVPDISQQSIRGPIISNIRAKFRKFDGVVRNIDDFIIKRNEYGIFNIGLPEDRIMVMVSSGLISVADIEW